MQVRNEYPVGDCSSRPEQPHKMSRCRVVALSLVRTNRIKVLPGCLRLTTGPQNAGEHSMLAIC